MFSKKVSIYFALTAVSLIAKDSSGLIINENVFDGDNWAVLVAGSNTYFNYRHQADVCHAFQDLISHGIPESNIIVMMYDDIANSTQNPTPGVMINQPNGPNVYSGVPKDYTGTEVNPTNFMKVLLGDLELERQGKKVLKSGPDDRVFIYFADHGGELLIGFPNDILRASELIRTLEEMHKKKKFSQLVFYLEACESGSMFEGLLLNNLSIYAVTAARPYEPSSACFYNEFYQAYLGDQFSVNWLIDADVGKDLSNETFEKQFLKIQNETTQSMPQQYGDLSMANLNVSSFLGTSVPPSHTNPFIKCDDPIETNEVPLEVMKMRIKNAAPMEKAKLKNELEEMLLARDYLKETVRKVVEHLCSKGHCDSAHDLLTTSRKKITRHDCAEKLIMAFHKHCFNLAHNTYATRYLKVFVNLVESLKEENLDKKCNMIKHDLNTACTMYANNKFFSII